jgi:hypothetical protein
LISTIFGGSSVTSAALATTGFNKFHLIHFWVEVVVVQTFLGSSF